AGGRLAPNTWERRQELDRLVAGSVLDPVEVRVILQLAGGLLDPRSLGVGEASGADRLDDLVGRRVAHLLPGGKPLPKPVVGDVPVRVVCVLGEDGPDELRDRMAVWVVHGAPVEVAQPVSDRPHAALRRPLPAALAHGPSIW